MKEKVEAAIECLKRDKAPGIDNITAEMIQAAKARSADMLHFLLQNTY